MKNARLKLILPRVLLGAIFFVSGLHWFLDMAPPFPYSTEGMTFIRHLQEAGLFWGFLKAIELGAGVLLLARSLGTWVVLGLAPLTMAIVLFHLLLSPTDGAWLGYLAFALEVTLLILFRKNIAHMFRNPKSGTP